MVVGIFKSTIRSFCSKILIGILIKKGGKESANDSKILLLILNFFNAYKYGVQKSIIMPSFIIMTIATLVWSLIYLSVIRKKTQ